MADTGWLNLATFATGGGTGVAWTSPGSADVSDNVYASASLPAPTSTETLNATNLVSSINAGATVLGVEVRIERKANSTGVTDLTISLIKGGTISGDNKSAGAGWGTTDSYTSFGGATDMWGLTLSPSDVNDSTFGFCVAAQTGLSSKVAYVDHMQMKIYYSLPTSSFFVFF